MSLQAQIRQWVDDRLHEIVDPLFERLDKAVERLDVLEHYVKTFEQSEGVPSHPAPRGKGPEVKSSAPAADSEARKTPVTGRPSGRPPVSKGRAGS
jgi:hypothetical protein